MTKPKESKTHFERVPLELVKKIVEKTRTSKRPEPVRPRKLRQKGERYAWSEGAHLEGPSVHMTRAA